MNAKTIAWAVAAVAAVGLTGCSSDSTSESAAESTSSAAPTSTSAAPPPMPTAPPTPAPAGGVTLSDYLASAGITQTPARPREAGAPAIDLPVPEGWEIAIDVPGDAFWAVIPTAPVNSANPPIIQATLTKLSADVPVQTVFDYAAGDLKNLPGYQSLGEGGRAALGGLEAYQVGGMYDNKGTQTLVAQKTVRIESPSGLYLLEVRAAGPEDDAQSLVSATGDIDDGTVITP